MKYLALIILSIFIISCSSEPKTLPPAEITNLVEYKDEASGMGLLYPENWEMQSTTGKSMFAFSIPEARGRFTSYYGIGDPVARLQLGTMKIDSTKSFDDIMEGKMIFDPKVYQGPEYIMLEDSIKAVTYTYSFELNDGLFKGRIIGATKDSILATIFRFETFGNTYDKYKPDLDKMIESISLAVLPELKDTIFIQEELPLPSSNLVTKSGDGYSIKIPDNFKAGNYKSDQPFARKYDGERRGDSYIVVEKLKNSKKSLDKIVELNAKQMNLKDVEKMKVNGQEAFLFAYDTRPGKNKRRIYFLKKGDTPYRLIVDWAVEEEKEYLPIFEKSINSFKMK